MKYLIILCLLTGCYFNSLPLRKNYAVECTNNIVKENAKDSTFIRVYKELNDTMLSWKKMGVNGYVNMQEGAYLLDSCILFNSTRDRCIAFNSNVIEVENPYDLTELIGGIKYDNKWYFFYQGYACTYYRRENNGNKPYNLKQLSALGRNDHVLESALIKNCLINNDLINNELNSTLEWDPRAKTLAPHFGVKPYYK